MMNFPVGGELSHAAPGRGRSEQGDEQLPVTRPYLPARADYASRLDEVWESNWLTNNGRLSRKLESEIRHWLGVAHLQLVSSGTSALQLALAALDVRGTVITPAFSFVATCNAPLWLNCRVKTVDADPATFCIDPAAVEAAITPDVTAIVATHVYGIPCDVEALADIARRHGLKLVYDGAHAFGSRVHDRPVLDFGDAAAASFHATKLFHCVEGGGVVTHDRDSHEAVGLLKAHGLRGDDVLMSGINARMSEFHAAMGLAILPKVGWLIAERKRRFAMYAERLGAAPVRLIVPEAMPDVAWNYAYFPVVLEDEATTIRVRAALAEHAIEARRYFWPSLSQLDYVEAEPCPVAEDLSRRVLCLPFGHWISEAQIDRVATVLIDAL